MKSQSFKVSDHGNLLIYDRKYSANDVRYIIETNHLNGLRIFDIWDPLPSLDFLRGLVFLKSLSITCDDDQDYSFLRDMPQLELLSIGPSFPMENPIDLSKQANLKYLSIQWRNNRIYGLDACRNLEDLCLVEFKDVDLRLIKELSRLIRLRIKTGSIKSLDGIENVKNLEILEIGNCRSLRSIASLNGLHRLKSVRIESCRKIEDYENLNDLPSLKTLQLVNCGPLAATDLKEKLPKLETLQLLGNSKLKEPEGK